MTISRGDRVSFIDWDHVCGPITAVLTCPTVSTATYVVVVMLAHYLPHARNIKWRSAPELNTKTPTTPIKLHIIHVVMMR